MPTNGEVAVIEWIAEDVGDAAPPNTVIRTVPVPITNITPEMVTYVASSEVTRPTNGWPIGQYRVEIKRGDHLDTTARFTIQ